MIEKLVYSFWPDVGEGSLMIVTEQEEVIVHMDLFFDLSDGRDWEQFLKEICDRYNKKER